MTSAIGQMSGSREQMSQGRPLHILGIETSCDETAAAVVRLDGPERAEILSNVVRSQIDAHRAYGGVVPEIAARAHVEVLDGLIVEALDRAGISLSQCDGIAATAGPGLIGGLIVGLATAKALALAADKPLMAVNHLEAHALTPGLTDGLAPPYLLLLVSGGHTQIQVVQGVGRYRRLGTTIDDALGEAFDKTSKLLGLGYPGGPEVERRARSGDPARFDLPRPLFGRAEPHFSFSGLKTAVRHAAEAAAPLGPQDIADLCASFEAAVADCVADRLKRAFAIYDREANSGAGGRVLSVVGGVAANQRLRTILAEACERAGYRLVIPPPALCTDNAAMVAYAGGMRYWAGLTDGLDAVARARWPLDVDAARAPGAGIKA